MSDYINREAAKQVLSCMLVKRVADIACSLVDSVSAADVEPVRHRRWIIRKEHLYLADGVCKEWYNFFCSAFCPSCGAKMDLEEDNNVTIQQGNKRG